jgi:hypothetical protein
MFRFVRRPFLSRPTTQTVVTRSYFKSTTTSRSDEKNNDKNQNNNNNNNSNNNDSSNTNNNNNNNSNNNNKKPSGPNWRELSFLCVPVLAYLFYSQMNTLRNQETQRAQMQQLQQSFLFHTRNFRRFCARIRVLCVRSICRWRLVSSLCWLMVIRHSPSMSFRRPRWSATLPRSRPSRSTCATSPPPAAARRWCTFSSQWARRRSPSVCFSGRRASSAAMR